MSAPAITLSIVSHGQNDLVNPLLGDLREHCAGRIALVLTQNIADSARLDVASWSGPVEVVANNAPKGFGANHNAAFRLCRTPCFCVCNPDIRLPADPFGALLSALKEGRAGVVGPLVRTPGGMVEDSARRFPTVASLAGKLLGSRAGPEYPHDAGPIEVDWIAGMFMLFDAAAYRELRGFDEAYFLYYEDVDICRRLRSAGKTVVYDPRAEVVHDARRASRRNPRLALHHAASMLRFLSRDG